MIVLFNPRSAQWKHRLPLSILSLGAVLEGRYDYEIVDGNIEPNPEEKLAHLIREKGARFLGVTVMPGPQLREAIPLTQKLKSQFPDLIAVWGGYFPSLHTNVTLESGFVDFVIRGQGELSLLELIRAVTDRAYSSGDCCTTVGPVYDRASTLDSIPGLSFKRNGRIIHVPKRAVTDPNTLPPLPYHRVDVRQYLGKTCLGTRTISYHSSFGCPFLCGFCAVAAVYKGRWIGRHASAVAVDVLWLRDEYGVNAVEFIDNNFFVAEHRTAEIAGRLEGSGIAWWGEARPDTLMDFSDATWQIMRDGGCKMIFFGAESSSNAVLELMDKGGTQSSDTVLQLAERMKHFGIIPEFSFVLGTPSRDAGAQIERDIRYIRRIKEINPQTEIVIYLYSPVFFDDAALLQQARNYGFEFPQHLADWLQPAWLTFDLRKDPKTPWLEPRHIERIMNFERVLNARFPTVSDIKLKAWQTRILKTLGAWRYKFRFYSAPWEIRLVANWLFQYRQPETEGF